MTATPFTRANVVDQANPDAQQQQQQQRHQAMLRKQREADASSQPESKANESSAQSTQPTRRRKRDILFGWLRSSGRTNHRVVNQPRVPVEIPDEFLTPNHRGVVVGGHRVPFVRKMHVTRQQKLTSSSLSCVPESDEVTTFPYVVTSFLRDQAAEYSGKRSAHRRLTMLP